MCFAKAVSWLDDLATPFQFCKESMLNLMPAAARESAGRRPFPFPLASLKSWIARKSVILSSNIGDPVLRFG